MSRVTSPLDTFCVTSSRFLAVLSGLSAQSKGVADPCGRKSSSSYGLFLACDPSSCRLSTHFIINWSVRNVRRWTLVAFIHTLRGVYYLSGLRRGFIVYAVMNKRGIWGSLIILQYCRFIGSSRSSKTNIPPCYDTAACLHGNVGLERLSQEKLPTHDLSHGSSSAQQACKRTY